MLTSSTGTASSSMVPGIKSKTSIRPSTTRKRSITKVRAMSSLKIEISLYWMRILCVPRRMYSHFPCSSRAEIMHKYNVVYRPVL
jgi:hypothetical protein